MCGFDELKLVGWVFSQGDGFMSSSNTLISIATDQTERV